jgi:hypothetical protein
MDSSVVRAFYPAVSEIDKVRDLKQIANSLGLSRQQLNRRWEKGELVVLVPVDGAEKLVPLIYDDLLGYWSPRSYLEQFKRAHERALPEPPASSRHAAVEETSVVEEVSETAPARAVSAAPAPRAA